MLVAIGVDWEGARRQVLAVDFCKEMDGLAALVREGLGSDPFSGVVYVFRRAGGPTG